MNILNVKEAEQQAQNNISASHSESKNEMQQFHIFYGKKLQSPILGHRYQLPDLPTNCLPTTTLDTSLPHIPVYAHLKIYNLKPVRRPRTPPILSTLRLQFSEDARKFSKEISSSARISGEDATSTLCSARDSAKITCEKR